MIIRRHRDRQLLITQPDHAALSAYLMAGWRRDGFPAHSRRETILLATREHDAGWAELDRAPIVDERSGRILDFVQAPDEVRQSVWPRSVALLAGEPYAAALVAQHALTVYRDNRSDPAWSDFFREMEELRARRLAAVPTLTLDNLLADYFFVRMGDLISLFFANNWPGPRAEGDYTVRVAEGQVTVSPDPFEGRRLPFTLQGHLMPAGPYASDAAAATAFAAATVVLLEAVAAGS